MDRVKAQRLASINCLNDLQNDDEENWLIVGDLNFYRSLEDRNKPGGNLNDINLFNEVISNLGLIEIPLKGRKYTYSNMQVDPLYSTIGASHLSIGL